MPTIAALHNGSNICGVLCNHPSAAAASAVERSDKEKGSLARALILNQTCAVLPGGGYRQIIFYRKNVRYAIHSHVHEVFVCFAINYPH